MIKKIRSIERLYLNAIDRHQVRELDVVGGDRLTVDLIPHSIIDRLNIFDLYYYLAAYCL